MGIGKWISGVSIGAMSSYCDKCQQTYFRSYHLCFAPMDQGDEIGSNYYYCGKCESAYFEKPHNCIEASCVTIPTGWQCPKCEGIMAPTAMTCVNCKAKVEPK